MGFILVYSSLDKYNESIFICLDMIMKYKFEDLFYYVDSKRDERGKRPAMVIKYQISKIPSILDFTENRVNIHEGTYECAKFINSLFSQQQNNPEKHENLYKINAIDLFKSNDIDITELHDLDMRNREKKKIPLRDKRVNIKAMSPEKLDVTKSIQDMLNKKEKVCKEYNREFKRN